jgi:hypothetical protein
VIDTSAPLMRFVSFIRALFRHATTWAHKDSPKAPTIVGVQWRIPFGGKRESAVGGDRAADDLPSKTETHD